MCIRDSPYRKPKSEEFLKVRRLSFRNSLTKLREPVVQYMFRPSKLNSCLSGPTDSAVKGREGGGRLLTGIKTWSNSQATSRGAIKRSSSHFHHLYCTVNGQDSVNEPVAHAHYPWVIGSMAHIWCGQEVKTDFGQSRILTPVTVMCTAPICITPPLGCCI